MMTDTDRRAHLGLDAGPQAPACARDFLTERCLAWAVPQLVEAGSLVVSELVTNAVRHAGTDIVLRLALDEDALVVAVFDSGGGEPRIVPPEQRVLGGRGLAMVEKLAEVWGVRREAAGKSVWCRLTVRPRPVV